MNKKLITILMAAAVMLTLCGCLRKATYRGEPRPPAEIMSEDTISEGTLPPQTAPTAPADGNPEDVTCKGSYTAEHAGDTVVARAGTAELTQSQLQSWYWAGVAQYRQDNPPEKPDFDQPLDTQVCPIDPEVNSWQQYFLKQALNTWHASVALEQKSTRDKLVTEEAYQPNLTTHANCMTGMPATKFLYGYNKYYVPNTQHQTYLDNIPALLEQLTREYGFDSVQAMTEALLASSEEDAAEFIRQYNYAYMYRTFLNYDVTLTRQEAENWYHAHQAQYEASGIFKTEERCVDIRHILLRPEGSWTLCERKAYDLLTQWKISGRCSEATFGELAYRNSADPGTAANGGRYDGLLRGQLPEPLDSWCFATERRPGDTAVLQTEDGVHILYYAEGRPLWVAEAEEDMLHHTLQEQIREAKDRFPMEVDYASIGLRDAEPAVSYADVLYPDIAHERYPEVPLYLQQDYPNTWFGNYKITSNGCGITTFAMLATYMSDEEWTPPEMCDLYGIYSHNTGTDGMLFINEASKYDIMFRERTFEHYLAKEALEEGYIVVSIQRVGYWTRAAHYLLFEKLTEDGMVQVRDSNIANYSRLDQHKVDKHEWNISVLDSTGYWIFEPKATRTAACSRCGDPDALSGTLLPEYLCEKCTEALSRRGSWIQGAAFS